ncbi:MAG: glycosyltransferase [Candidatus Hydrogenedentes bacterium]|nr:glycosyltransferase [Candidatus Hydrogenedentota bacterium]
MEPRCGGGPARIYTLIQYLRRAGCEVHLICQDHGREGNEALRGWADDVWIFRVDGLPVSQSKVRQWWLQWRRRAKHFHHRVQNYLWRRHRPGYKRLARWFPALFPPKVPRHSYILRKINPSFDEYAHEVMLGLLPTAAIAEFAWTARSLEGLPPEVLTMIDTHDIQHQRRQRAQEAGSDLKDRACTREEEVAELNRARILLAIQPEEGDILRDLCPGREVLVVEHAEVCASCETPPHSQQVLFVGNLYDPNIQGLRQFLDDVWPRVRQACPEATLQVCGNVCKSVENSPPGVQLAGFVEDLESCYAAAAVVVNPVPYGTGLKIKTVEALLRGKALVTTECGVEGLGAPDRQAFILATIAGMAEPLINLLVNFEQRHELEQAACDYAASRLSQSRAYGDLLRRMAAHRDAQAANARRA